MSRQPKTYVSPEDYLARERKAEFKSEYFDGEIVAFAGASREHNLIFWNFAGELRTQLKGTQCEAYSADMRVKAGRGYVYPDVVAVCGPPAFADGLFDVLLNPTLLVEVLSESTEFHAAISSRTITGPLNRYRNIFSFHKPNIISSNTPDSPMGNGSSRIFDRLMTPLTWVPWVASCPSGKSTTKWT
jgi:hypothetical protein